MRSQAFITGALIAGATIVSGAAEMPLAPGLYEVEVRISLPNVQDVARPLLVSRCIAPDDLESGRAFFVLSDNPLKSCNLVDFEAASGKALYRIECPGPNRGSAVAMFDLGKAAFRGTIKMNMGGKNMTMAESQSGKRVGDCP